MATIFNKHRVIETKRLGKAIACVLFAARAIAQDTGSSVTPAAASDSLAEIIVTAERREETLDKVPISVTAFSQKTMDDLRIQSFSDLAQVVPGLVVSTVPAGGQGLSDVAIRGIFSGGNAPTTQFYIDETPIAIRRLDGAGPSGSPHPEIFDLDRVEVLRGPQGTLFGSSAMGGAIRYITPQPNLEDSSGFGKADVGYTDRGDLDYEVGVAYGAPIVTGTAGFRVSAWYQQLGGFIDREDPFTGQIYQRNANSSDSYVIRPAFTWAPKDGLTITPSLFLQQINQANPNTYWMNYLPNPENGAHVSGNLVAEPLADNLNVSSLAIKYLFAGLSFQSDTSYLDRQYNDFNDWTHGVQAIVSGSPFIEGVPQSFASYEHNLTFTHAWAQEFRLSSQDPSSRVNWVAGLFYRRAVQDLTQILPPDLSPVTEVYAGKTSVEFFGIPSYVLNGQALNGYTDFETTDISEAVFGQLDVEILPRLKAAVGVRVEHSVVEHQNEIAAGPLDGATYSNVTLADQIGNPVTPKASLTYQYTDNDMLYVSAAKGYRDGGGNPNSAVGNPLCGPSLSALGLSGVPAAFNSDSLWSYEIGSKNSLFNRRVDIQASAYYINWSNIQTFVFLPSCAGSFTANRGNAVSQGFDLQVAAIVVEGLKLSANVGYTDAYYPKAAFGAPSNGVVPVLNAAGDKLPNVLPWTASADAEYSRDISPLWAGTRSYIRFDYRWLSAATALNPHASGFDTEVGPYQNEAYGMLNVRLGVVHGGLDLSAYVNNATNSDPRLGVSHDVNPDNLYSASAIRPRTAGVSAWYRF